MQNYTPVKSKPNNTKIIEIGLRSYASLIESAQELAEAWGSMEEEEQVLQRAFVMSDWGKRHELGELYHKNELSPAQVDELARLDHALLDQAANIEIAYGPSIGEKSAQLGYAAERGTGQCAVNCTGTDATGVGGDVCQVNFIKQIIIIRLLFRIISRGLEE